MFCFLVNGLIACSSFSFLLWIVFGWNDVGGSMRNSESIWSMWFCMMLCIVLVVL